MVHPEHCTYCLMQAEEWLSDISNLSLLFCSFTLILRNNGANLYLLRYRILSYISSIILYTCMSICIYVYVCIQSI